MWFFQSEAPEGDKKGKKVCLSYLLECAKSTEVFNWVLLRETQFMSINIH